MNRKRLEMVLGILTIVSAAIAWFCVDRAIRIPDSSTWIVPMTWFSIFVVLLYLNAILSRKKTTTLLVLGLSFSCTLLFAFTLWHSLILLVSITLANWGIANIRNDLGSNVTISLWKSLLTGKTQIIWALALLISSQYLVIISGIEGQKNMPKLNIGESVTGYVIPMLGFINPTFKEINKENLTVDEYLLKAQKDGEIDGGLSAIGVEIVDSQIPTDISIVQRELLKQEATKKMLEAQNQLSQKNKDLILIETRKQFSKSIGQELRGDEKIAEVLAGVVGLKMNELLQTPLKGGGTVASILPLIFSIVLFLTIIPLSSWFLSLIWTVLVIIIFKSLVRIGFIEIGKETVEKEIIQY